MTPEQQAADKLLARIAIDRAELEQARQDLDVQIQPYINLYGRIMGDLSARIAENEKRLQAHVKRHPDAVMAGSDRVELPCGAILMKIEKRVRRIKKMLDKLKAAGRTDAIRTAESVNWDAIETWPDRVLQTFGTRRQAVVNVDYEIKKRSSS